MEAPVSTTTPVRPQRRELLVSKWWIQGGLLVAVLGLFGLVLMGFQTYQHHPPIPERVVTGSGETVFTGADVINGQKAFLGNGLMEYGSIFGHGAYLGPDFTADYLHRAAEHVRESYGGDGSDSAQQRTVEEFKTNRYDPATRTLVVSDAQAAAFEDLQGHYAETLGDPEGRTGLRPDAVT